MVIQHYEREDSVDEQEQSSLNTASELDHSAMNN